MGAVNDLTRRRPRRSHFFTKLREGDSRGKLKPDSEKAQRAHARVERWTRGVDVFAKKFLLVPVVEDLHWSLAIVCHPGELSALTWRHAAPTPGDLAKRESVKHSDLLPAKFDSNRSQRSQPRKLKRRTSMDDLSFISKVQAAIRARADRRLDLGDEAQVVHGRAPLQLPGLAPLGPVRVELRRQQVAVLDGLALREVPGRRRRVAPRERRELARVADDGQAPVQVLDNGHEEELLREDVDAARPALYARVRALRLLAVGLELAARVALAELREEVRPARASTSEVVDSPHAVDVADAVVDENAWTSRATSPKAGSSPSGERRASATMTLR